MDITQDLVEQIVDLVLKQIAAFPKMPDCTPTQKITAVFCGGMSGAEEARQAIQELADKGYQVKALFTPRAEQVNGGTWLQEKAPKVQVLSSQCSDSPKALIDETDLLLIPVLTCNSAAKLACGMAENTALSAVLFAMMSGKPIIAAEDACRGRPGTPVTEHILKKNVLTLKQCGIQFVPACRLKKQAVWQLGTDHPAAQTSGGLTQRYDGRVLSIRQLCALCAETVLVSKDTIITPAAADEARKRRIELKRETSWER